MTFPILGGNGAVTGFSIDNSLRFNDDDNAYLSKTLSASPTNQKIVSCSFWVKRANLGVYSYNLVGNTSAPYVIIGFINDDTFSFQLNAGSGSTGLITTAKFRDTSAWYHTLCVLDTTQGTASNRMKMYINGVQITDFGTANYPAQDSTWNINTNVEHSVGGSSAIQDFDGYMAECYFIDGQALSPTDFGEFDEDSGIWKPKRYSGSYGTNGFKLNFSDSGSLGADSSPNSNNFTPTNLASTDQTTDTPTNNFCTMNPLAVTTAGTATFSEGNCQVATVVSGSMGGYSTLEIPSSGVWYCEAKITTSGVTNAYIGLVPYSATDSNSFVNGNSVFYYGNGTKYVNGSNSAYGTGWSQNDIIGIKVDADSSTVEFYLNGSSQGSISHSVANMHFNCGDTNPSVSHTFQWNFGSPVYSISSGNSDANGYGNFEYSPSGGLALCTQNLATELSPTIDDGSAYFQTKTYTGNGVETAITNDGNSNLQPDLIWFKARSAAYYHGLFDSTRGTELRLSSNVNDAEVTKSSAFTSFDSDGFTVGADVSNTTNASGQTFVAWQWKANGGTTSTNTDGSQNSTVQVNSTAGFSIVKRTGTGSAGATYGHGLGVAPEVIINKGLNTNEWYSYFKAIGGGSHWIDLSGTGAAVSDVNMWNNTDATSSVFTVGNSGGSNASGVEYINYCFHSVEFYSKMGKYTGNGNADGTFIYTGFRPAFTIIKKTSDTGIWFIYDTKRDIDNVVVHRLLADDAQAENTGSGDDIDIVSNGFKVRSSASAINASGQTFLYMAFAESPFVSSSGVPVVAR